MGQSFISIRGAREHNLKNINLDIPREKFVVITGLSGSGKSTLAFDTIYAEGQRRYVESLSAYARQFLEQMDKPDVESIDGLSPAISIEQKATSRNPRSTVGTITEIYDYLRLLFARIGQPYCYKCHKPIASQTVTQMVDQLASLKEGSRISVLAPIAINRKGEFVQDFDRLKKGGFTRVRVDGDVMELDEPIRLDKKKKHTIDLFVDRLVIKKTMGNRLSDSIETALRHGNGVVKIEVDGGEPMLLSEHLACITCGISYPELSPQMFSFNSPIGACTTCNGLGTKLYFDDDLIVPNPALSLREGAIVPWQQKVSTYYMQVYQSLAKHYKFDVYTPFGDLSDFLKEILLRGSGTESIRFDIERQGRVQRYDMPFSGVIPQLEEKWEKAQNEWEREEVERYMSMRPCPTCHGARLRNESLHIKIQGMSIADITNKSIAECATLFEAMTLSQYEFDIAKRVLKEIRSRLTFLNDVGLSYLSLNRTAGTLSGGEAQRIRLATQIGSALTGVLYVLDEPSIGLHQRDNDRLINTLHSLRDLGNTVLVVEHDEDTILASDYIIDMGPGAGIHGGQVVATGTPSEVMTNPDSLTGQYLSGKVSIPVPTTRRKPDDRWVTIHGAEENNLQNIEARFPIGLFTCVTGVSGSGKSTLVNDTLHSALVQRLYRTRTPAGKHSSIDGLDHLDHVINIDQSPIGRTPRSNPATYTGVFTFIRDLFASLPVSKARGYKPGRFSFNVKGGRCEACEGDGVKRIEMMFLPDVFVRCEVCAGRRFNRETLEVEYKGASIYDVLRMSVAQAHAFFSNIPSIRNKLQTLLDVGLDYIELGQSGTTLSGGEAQRIKLSRELSKRATGRTLYILDEPTTGLHFADIQKLLEVLSRLVESGNTVIVIEHNLDVIKSADYIVDLGPEGGDGGGEIVATGTPEAVSKITRSYTGKYLARVLK